MDLFVVPTIGCKLLYGFVILRIDRRDLVWINVTTNPTAEWIARQITEAFPWDGAPGYMIRDRDRIYGAVVTRRLRAMGIRDKPIAPASPWQNGFAERLIGSIRRECLDHVIVLGEAHLRRIMKSYARYYNGFRTHRSLNKRYAEFSAGSAIRSHKFVCHLGRTSPSLRAGLIFRYTHRDDRPFGGAGPPMVAYRFEDSRSGDCIARHLAGFSGLLQVDGYAAYNRLTKEGGANDGVTLAACFAHVRSARFYELHVNESSHLATQTITTMAALWKVEEDIRGKDPATRVKARQKKYAAIVARLFELWETELPRLSGKSKLAEAIRYAISRRTALERFLSDGRVEIDSNIVERAIRPQTITRKNALLAGSAGGGRTWATVATLLQTAKMNDVDPHAWLTQTLERIAQGWPISSIDQLMPWNFKA
jgi:hypothetical protein